MERIPSRQITEDDRPTVWGLKPDQIHDRFWASRGIQVVRRGDPRPIAEGAELFLLTPARSLVIFRLGRLVNTLSWVKPKVLFIRLRDVRERGYREFAVTDELQRLVRFQRIYGGSDPRLSRVALTPHREVALLWKSAPDPRSGWNRLRRHTSPLERARAAIAGRVYDSSMGSEAMQFLRDLMETWKRPDSTVKGVKRVRSEVWADSLSRVNRQATFVGPVWVGAGRRVESGTNVVGPAVLWDESAARPAAGDIGWGDIVPTASMDRGAARRPRRTDLGRLGKRAFDVAASLLALLVTLPTYPLVMLAIWLEDGHPFFFIHRRETLGGRAFPCLKFRSMRRDAEKVKQELMKKNQVDGPQFYINKDPRLLRIGGFLRASKIDELPQFLNVFLGHMSIVGPRPSPFDENQFCPSWRETRLSVRPGITGLWQVKRTRRRGLDFQEWIKYDIEYVERWSWKLDLWIIWRTVWSILRGK